MAFRGLLPGNRSQGMGVVQPWGTSIDSDDERQGYTFSCGKEMGTLWETRVYGMTS